MSIVIRRSVTLPVAVIAVGVVALSTSPVLVPALVGGLLGLTLFATSGRGLFRRLRRSFRPIALLPVAVDLKPAPEIVRSAGTSGRSLNPDRHTRHIEAQLASDLIRMDSDAG